MTYFKEKINCEFILSLFFLFFTLIAHHILCVARIK